MKWQMLVRPMLHMLAGMDTDGVACVDMGTRLWLLLLLLLVRPLPHIAVMMGCVIYPTIICRARSRNLMILRRV